MSGKASINTSKLPVGAGQQRVEGGQDPSGKMDKLHNEPALIPANEPRVIEDPTTGEKIVIVKQRPDGLTFLPKTSLCPEKSPEDPPEKRGWFKTMHGNIRRDN